MGYIQPELFGKHGRICMVASMGYIQPELFGKHGCICMMKGGIRKMFHQ